MDSIQVTLILEKAVHHRGHRVHRGKTSSWPIQDSHPLGGQPNMPNVPFSVSSVPSVVSPAAVFRLIEKGELKCFTCLYPMGDGLLQVEGYRIAAYTFVRMKTMGDLSIRMPFRADFTPVYSAIQGGASDVKMSCERADDIWEHHAIIQDIVNSISRARVVVCDCTGKNPNVFYEAGIAHTLGKEVILIAQSEEDIPFDLRHLRFIKYHSEWRRIKKFVLSNSTSIGNNYRETVTIYALMRARVLNRAWEGSVNVAPGRWRALRSTPDLTHRPSRAILPSSYFRGAAWKPPSSPAKVR